MTDENKKKKHHRRRRKIHRFNLGEPIPPIHHWLDYTPVIPKLYWDVYSQEERWKKLCIEYDRLCAYANFLAKNINSLIDEIEKILEEIETIKTELENCKTRLTALESWQTTINTWKKTVDDHLSDIDSDIANIKVDITNIKTRITNLESNVNNLTARMSKAESNITTAQTNINSLDQRTTTAEGNIAELQTESETATKDITDLKNKFPVSLDNISDDAKIDTVTAQSKKLVTSGAVYNAIKDITGFTKQKNCLVIGTFGPRTDLYPTNLINFTEIVDSGYSLTAIKEETLTQISLGVADYDYIVLTGGVSNYFDTQEYPSAQELAEYLCNFNEITTALNNSTNLAKPKVFYVNDIQCDAEDVDVEKIGLYATNILSDAYRIVEEYQHSNIGSAPAELCNTFINYSNFNLWPNKNDTENKYFDKNNNPTELCTRSNAMAILGAIGYIQPPIETIGNTYLINEGLYMNLCCSQEGVFINATARGSVPLSTNNYTFSYNNNYLISTQNENSSGWLFGNTLPNHNLMRILQRVVSSGTLKILCDITAQDAQYSKNDVLAQIKFHMNSYTTFNEGCTVVSIPGNYGDVSTMNLTLTIKDIYL